MLILQDVENKITIDTLYSTAQGRFELIHELWGSVAFKFEHGGYRLLWLDEAKSPLVRECLDAMWKLYLELSTWQFDNTRV